MPRHLALLLLPFLAACGQESAPAGEADAAAATAVDRPAQALSPGRWQVASTIAGMGERQSEHLCITAEQAASGRFLVGELPEGCALERDSMAGGRIDFALRCGQMASTFTGTYDATTYRTETTVDMGAGEPMRATSTGTFVGPDCQADDQRLTVD
ncbi:DUF3617 domain-containing protein [Croceibacterium ferulae]|uniref:DUF3617 domain-containing protein n=1 Tax=Croceibacterium ferulae TaxID=1854641 RepID=UPI0013906220|nr:DUF3617 family protein [Croceibacterium ferulae]